MPTKSTLKGWLLPPFFLSVLATTQPGYADAVQPYFIFDSFSYSETVPIKDALEDWEGDSFESGERQWTWNWFELGMRYSHWGVGLVQRYDYDLRFSKDAAELYWLTSNKQPLPVGKEYSAQVEANAFHSTGLRLTFSDTIAETTHYTLGLSYLYANYMVDGFINGNATVLNESDYDYDAQVEYHYSEDHLFDRPVEKPKGNGFAIDAEFDYQFESGTRIELQVRDLFARIYWRDSPYTRGHATSDRKEYDDNGYVSINPVLTGFEGTDSQYVQRLEPRWYAKIKHSFTGSYGGLLQYRYQYGHSLFGLGASSSIGESGSISASYWPMNQAIEVNWQNDKLQLSVTADQVSISDLQTLWLSVAYGL